jgi:hypothetical protein
VTYDLNLPANCPLPSVGEFDGVAYRVVFTDPPTQDDLLTYLELGKAPKVDTCKRGSVSLYATLEDAQHLIDARPYVGNFVASLTLTKAHGRVSVPSDSGHIDWWPYKDMRRVGDLKVVK